MRKVFWCCLAGGAVVCCAFWAVAYISQNPDSPLGRCALTACHVAAPSPGSHGGADAEDLIPPDPVPVEDLPPLPEPGSHLPPAVAALIPPIVIHEEDDLNAAPGPNATSAVSAVGRVDVECARPSTLSFDDVGRSSAGAHTSDSPTAPQMMPYCSDDDNPAPRMPYCADDDGKTGCGPSRTSDAFAVWLGFFSGPSHFGSDPSIGRCEEDAHYGQQYPGLPYTTRAPVEPPAHADLGRGGVTPPLLPAFPGAAETSEPAPKAGKHADPTELFSHPHHLPAPRPAEPESDTMEMRPSDWKPYSLDPGPF